MPNTLQHYICVFTIDGVKHTFRGYTPTKQAALDALRNVVSRRNVDIPSEQTVLDEASLKYAIKPEEADKIEQQVRDENPDGTVATDLHPDVPNRILHEPVRGDATVRELERQP